MNILKKASIPAGFDREDEEELKWDMDPYFAGQAHQTSWAWGRDAQSVYRLETAPANVAHDEIRRFAVDWDAVQEEYDLTPDPTELIEIEGFLVGEGEVVWTSEIDEA